MKHKPDNQSYNRGLSLIVTVIFMSISVLFIIGLTQWAVLHAKLVRQSQDRELALQVAEAGIEYYRWHLAHAPEDFQDGQASPAPSYTHEYYDKDGNHIGKFILYITAPQTGSTLMTLVSEGRIDKNPNIFRKIKVQMGIPSWAKYAFAIEDVVRFGVGSEVFGEIRSNKGIRFDGLAHNLVSSAKDKYSDPSHGDSQSLACTRTLIRLTQILLPRFPIVRMYLWPDAHFPLGTWTFPALLRPYCNLKQRPWMADFIAGSPTRPRWDITSY